MARRALALLFLEAVIVCGCIAVYAAGQTRKVTPAEGSAVAAASAVWPDVSTDPGTPPTLDPTPAPTPTPTASPSPSPTPGPAARPTPVAAPTPDPFAVTNFAPVPACVLGNTPALLATPNVWQLTLVDKTYSVGNDYVPPDLVNVSAAGFGGSYRVRAVMIDDLRAMKVDAGNAGAPLAISSAYRSYQEQVWSFGHWTNALGPAALMSSARPGHSEHQLGLAIDFRGYGTADPWDYKDFARDTAAGAWLAKNAWKYGFVESYPWAKTAQVCYGYEPWHYRYVGRAEAAAIRASGQTPRVWLWQHQPDQLWRTKAAASSAPGAVQATPSATVEP